MDRQDLLSENGKHTCTVLLFGSPQIARDGLPVRLDTRKALALLAVLAVSEARTARDELAALVWPEADANSARGTLRRTLSTLKRAIGSDSLSVDRQAIGLNSDRLEVDVTRFSSLLATARAHGHRLTQECHSCLPVLRKAIQLHRGDFLAGFSIRDAPEFEDWQVTRCEAYRRELAAALEGASRTLAAQGDLDGATAFAERLLALDSLNETAHQLLMRIYSQAGDRPAAIRQYKECLRLLHEELAVAPVEETVRLFESIANGDGVSSQISPSATRPVSPSSSQLPLVGREAEWETLASVFDRISAGPEVVVVEGEAGIGKTRLLEDLLELARARGAVILSSRCYEGEANLAYAPLMQFLRRAVDFLDKSGRLGEIMATDLAEVGRLVPDLNTHGADPLASTDTGPVSRAAAQTHFLDAVCRVLLACGLGSRLLITVDDLQWADEASLDWLAYLIRRLTGRRVGVIFAWRSHERPMPEAFRRLVSDARRSGFLTTIALERLDRENVAELLEKASGNGLNGEDEPAADVGTWLFDESEGLPLLLAEYLEAFREGILDRTLHSAGRDLLASRVSAVSEGAGQILTAAAVIGRSFDFDTLRQSSGRDEEMVVAALEELQARGLVRELPSEPAGGVSYDFAHEKLRAVVLDRTTAARRRLLHRRTADAMASPRHERVEVASAQIAHHYREAGMVEQAAVFYRRAGEHAAELFATREALAHFQNALALTDVDAPALQESIGDLHMALGGYVAAIESYQSAAARTEGLALARIEQKLGSACDRWGEIGAAQRHYAAALEILRRRWSG